MGTEREPVPGTDGNRSGTDPETMQETIVAAVMRCLFPKLELQAPKPGEWSEWEQVAPGLMQRRRIPPEDHTTLEVEHRVLVAPKIERIGVTLGMVASGDTTNITRSR